jgi:hypothetical protein
MVHATLGIRAAAEKPAGGAGGFTGEGMVGAGSASMQVVS